MRESEVKKLLKENKLSWKEFKDWMRGQTIGVYSDGSPDYYDWDVERFIEGEKEVGFRVEW